MFDDHVQFPDNIQIPENDVLIFSDNEGFVIAKKPTFTKIPEILKNFKNFYPDRMFDFVKELLDGDVRFVYANGYSLYDVTEFDVPDFCYYCYSSFHKKIKYFTCENCISKHICEYCHEELVAEQRETGGARKLAQINNSYNADKFNIREKNLLQCISHVYNPYRNFIMTPDIEKEKCNKCKKIGELNIDSPYIISYDEDNDLIFMCDNCVNNHSEFAEKYSAKRLPRLQIYRDAWQRTKIGNILDYIQIYEDEYGCGIHLNLNPSATNFGKIAFTAYDDHGRVGFCLSNKSLENILSSLENLLENYDDFKTDDVDDTENSIVIHLMKEENILYHYG